MGETNGNHWSIFSMRFAAAPPSSRVPRGRTEMAKSIARLLVAAMAVAAMTLASVAGTGLAQAQTNTSTDRAALVALYNATDGDNWGNNTNWGSDMPLSPNPPMGGVKAGQIGMREPTREKAWAPLGTM